MKENRLKIHALNLNDLNLISAYLQDAICPTSEIFKFLNFLPSKNITNQKRGEFFEFLTIESKKMPDKNYEMKIIFAGNSIIKIIAEMIDVKLDDQGTPWDSKLKPKHNL